MGCQYGYKAYQIHGPNDRLPLQDLSHKLAMLMALTRPSRSADLANLDISRRTYS